MPPHWLFWDGDCGFCRRSVDWVRRHDAKGSFRIVPYQDAPRPPMTDELAARCAHAMHVLTDDGRLHAAGRASLFVLERVGWPRLARVLAHPPLVWAVELGYRAVARHRGRVSRWLGRRAPDGPACPR